MTIVLSTHYIDEAEKLSQRIIVMSNGKVIAKGIPKYLLPGLQARILAFDTGFIHLYYAETANEITPLMKYYGTRPMILRPSNLKDVFLSLID